MIRTIVVDDEPLALQLLAKKLSNFENIEVVESFSNAYEALQAIKHLDFQVAFLDIEMPIINGIDLAELIQEQKPDIHIVFVTASENYAIQAFELHSIDYLVKPVLNSRLEKTILRLQQQIQLSSQQSVVHQQNTPSLEVVCFAEFAAYSQGKLIAWKTAKVKELFAFFITNLNTPVNRDMLIDLLWPENEYQKAKIQLHTSISYLRKTLASIGYKNVLTFSNQSYILDLPHFTCDALELKQLIQTHKTIDHTNIGQLEQLTKKYTGHYMELNHYEWAVGEAENLHQQLLHLLQKMIDFYTAYNLPDKKQAYLQLLLQHDPYAEPALQQLMQHYIDVGNRGDAVKCYHDFKDILMKDLGILPNRMTNKIYNSIFNE